MSVPAISGAHTRNRHATTTLRDGMKMPNLSKRSAHNVCGLPTRGAVFSHRNTVDNLNRSLDERVLGTVVGGVKCETHRGDRQFATPHMMRWRRKVCQLLGKDYRPLTHSEFCEKYVGAKRARYQRAAKNILRYGLSPMSGRVAGFLKAEKWVEDKAPRMISPRSPEFLLASGVYIEPVEKRLYRAVAKTVGHECVMKGFNLGDRASVMRSHWDSFERPVAIGLDASKFDQHVSRQALQFEHGFYLSAYDNAPELQSLLQQQLRNYVKCYCEDGTVSWVSDGGRMSGDMNTALGNCLLSASMLYAWAESVGVTIRTVVDGDDCVAFMEQRDVGRFMGGLVPWYAARGFPMKVETPAFRFEDVEFCQCHPVKYTEGWKLIRDPVKAVTQDHVWLERGGITHLEVLQATGEGGVALCGDTPVLGSYYRMLRGRDKLSKRARRELHTENGWLRHFQGTFCGSNLVTDETRVSFALAFGILPSEQLQMEEYFSSFDVKAAIGEIINNKNTLNDLTVILQSNCPKFSCIYKV